MPIQPDRSAATSILLQSDDRGLDVLVTTSARSPEENRPAVPSPQPSDRAVRGLRIRDGAFGVDFMGLARRSCGKRAPGDPSASAS